MPESKDARSATVVIERCRRRGTSTGEAMIEARVCSPAAGQARSRRCSPKATHQRCAARFCRNAREGP